MLNAVLIPAVGRTAAYRGEGEPGELTTRVTPLAREISKINWARRRAFARLRHAYAVTTHKSQGSTFDVVILDLHDLSKMRSTFDFNRALYVAITRASKFISIVTPHSPLVQLEADLAAATDPSDAALLRQLIAEIRNVAPPPPPRGHTGAFDVPPVPAGAAPAALTDATSIGVPS